MINKEKVLSNIEGAIFDMDGTLISSMEAWRTVGFRYLRLFGIEAKPGLYEIIHPMSLEEACAYLHKEYGTTDNFPEFLKTLNSLMDDFYRNEVQMKDGAQAILDSLRSRGVKMCLATATDRALTMQCLERLQLLDYFSEVFTCDEIGAAKTKPDIYYAALDCLQTPKEHTWIFEDALYAVETATAAGFPVVGVYDKDSDDDQGTVARLSDIYLEDYAKWGEYFA